MTTTARARRRDQPGALSVTPLLGCGVVAGPLFVTAFVVQGAARPDYDPLRHSVSSLALAEFGWVQSLNFIIAGLLTLAFAAGVRRALRRQQGSTWGPLLIGLWGAGLIGAGIFATDPDSGYPPGSPVQILHPSVHGILHDLSAGLGFPALLAAFFVFARQFAVRGERGWAIYSAMGGAIFAISFVLAFYGFGRTEGLGAVGGLFERIAAICGFGWLTALAIHLLIKRSTKRAR
jgi:hypothetical protein